MYVVPRSSPSPYSETNNCRRIIGLQTPRLKRLAEIVSAQAIAQQEKLELEVGMSQGDGEFDGEGEGESEGALNNED